MKTKSIATACVLAASVALAAPLAGAAESELPAQAQRIWAPAGDHIGLFSHLTATYQAFDRYGDLAKLAEDWQVGEDGAGEGLFAYHKLWENSYELIARGYGTTASGEGLSGRVGLSGGSPGQFSWNAEYRGFDFFSDRDSETRTPEFPYPPPPPALDPTPHLNWDRGEVGLGWHIADGFDLSLGFARDERNGTKASLGRGFGNLGESAPALRERATATSRFRVGADFATGAAAMDLGFEYAKSDGSRQLGDRRTETDDQELVRGQLGVRFDVTPRSRLEGHGSLAKLDNQPEVAWRSGSGAPDGETTSRTGVLAFVHAFDPDLVLRLSAGFRSHDTTAQIDQGDAVLYATDRDNNRQDYRAGMTYTGLPNTRLRATYRFRDTDRTETTSQDALPGADAATRSQSVDEDRQDYDFAVRGTHRFSRQVKLKADFRWRRTESDPTYTWTTVSDDPWLYRMGPWDLERTDWRIGLPLRLSRTVVVDLGHQGIHQRLQRENREIPEELRYAETTWDATRGYANLNWLATDRLTFYGMASVGIETYELVDSSGPAGGMAPQNYDGTTWRFTPGVNWQLLPRLAVEGMYEGIRFEEDADASVSTIQKLQSDHDRFLARVRWQASSKVALTATYQRLEFDENRWDDYIQDLYAFSVGGRF